MQLHTHVKKKNVNQQGQSPNVDIMCTYMYYNGLLLRKEFGLPLGANSLLKRSPRFEMGYNWQLVLLFTAPPPPCCA